MNPSLSDIKKIIDDVAHIVIVQADNPDADSLGSSLALEHILGDMGKQVSLYCGVDMPSYLHYLQGWDRVMRDLPTLFDASIIVDASTITLLEKLAESGQMAWLKARPSIVLDHHAIVKNHIDFAAAMICDATASSTGELIYTVAHHIDWPISGLAAENLMTAILGDTQGLSNDLATARTYRIMAELIDCGANRSQLEELRREANKMQPEIYRYKGELIARTEFAADDRIATVTIPQSEINKYSPLYNPAPLIQNDMLQTEGVLVTIVFKHYDDGKITAAIRANQGAAVAGELAEYMGGGGHAYASGFKITDGRSFDDIKTTCLAKAAELLNAVAK